MFWQKIVSVFRKNEIPKKMDLFPTNHDDTLSKVALPTDDTLSKTPSMLDETLSKKLHDGNPSRLLTEQSHLASEFAEVDDTENELSKIFGDDYLVSDVLEGGMGKVFLGYSALTDKYQAAKTFKDLYFQNHDGSINKDMVQRFTRESITWLSGVIKTRW